MYSAPVFESCARLAVPPRLAMPHPAVHNHNTQHQQVFCERPERNRKRGSSERPRPVGVTSIVRHAPARQVSGFRCGGAGVLLLDVVPCAVARIPPLHLAIGNGAGAARAALAVGVGGFAISGENTPRRQTGRRWTSAIRGFSFAPNKCWAVVPMLPLDFRQRAGSALQRFFADVGVAVAHCGAFMADKRHNDGIRDTGIFQKRNRGVAQTVVAQLIRCTAAAAPDAPAAVIARGAQPRCD